MVYHVEWWNFKNRNTLITTKVEIKPWKSVISCKNHHLSFYGRVALFTPTHRALAHDPVNRFSWIFFSWKLWSRPFICDIIERCPVYTSQDICKKPLPTLQNITFSTISPEPIDRFCSSSNLTSLFGLPFRKKKVHWNRIWFTQVIVFTDRQTDRRKFFFADLASLGIDKQLCPWKHRSIRRVTNVIVNAWDPCTSYGSKNPGKSLEILEF